MHNKIFDPHKSTIGDLDANLIALIAYIGIGAFSFISGLSYIAFAIPLIIFFLEKESEFVKFHAMQATVLGVINSVLYFIIYVIIRGILINPLNLYAGIAAFLTFSTIMTIISIIIAVFAVIAAIAAYGYKGYNIPIVGGFAEKFAEKFKK